MLSEGDLRTKRYIMTIPLEPGLNQQLHLQFRVMILTRCQSVCFQQVFFSNRKTILFVKSVNAFAFKKLYLCEDIVLKTLHVLAVWIHGGV